MRVETGVSWVCRFCKLGHVCLVLIPLLCPVSRSYAEDTSTFSRLLVGEMECVESSDSGKTSVGISRAFIVAITPESILVGTSRDEEAGAKRWNFRYVSEEISHPVGIGLTLRHGELASPDIISVDFLAWQSSPMEQTFAGRRDSAEIAALESVSFALFFSSSYLGVDVSDVKELLQSEGGKQQELTKTMRCGRLRILRSPSVDAESNAWRIEELGFDQTSADFMTARNADRKLSSYKNDYFPNGLTSSTNLTTFDPPFNMDADTAFSAVCKTLKIGAGGERLSEKYRVNCTSFQTDVNRANKAISGTVDAVPNGTEVQTNGDINLYWQDGRVFSRLPK